MLFPLANLGDLQFRLLLIRPDFSPAAGRPLEVVHRFETLIGEGRTSIEERRPGRRALLHTQTCTLALRTAALADDWRKGLAALGERPVGLPLWIDALPSARWAERIYDGQKLVGWDPATGDFEIVDGPELPGSPEFPLYAPLLIGRWQERPPAEVVSGASAFVQVTVAEASPWSCRIRPHTSGAGWTAAPDRLSPVKDASEYGLELVALSAAREPALDRVNAAARWRQEGSFTFPSRTAIRAALTHFEAMQGALHAWSPVPAWFQPGADTEATPDNYRARFASDALALAYVSGGAAQATVAFLQEVDTGERSQALAGEFHLYQLKYQHDPNNPELFTDCDEPLATPEGTYQPRQISHQELRRSLKPQDDRATLKLAYAAGSLADDWLRGRLFGWVLLTVWRCDPADPAGTRGAPLYTGFVEQVAPAGNLLTLEAALFGRLLKERAPAAVFGPQCSTYVFSSRCGLSEATHDSEGTVRRSDLSPDGKTLTVHNVAGWGDTGYPANWFAHGLLRTGTGRLRVVVTVLASETSGTDQVLKLARPIAPDLLSVDPAQLVQLVPGCGRRYEADCGDKFANQQNFRGEPFMPSYLEQREPGAPKTPKK